MTGAGRFDVAVVGASVAGCTAARLFALAGARVALVERHADPAAYKVACTHAILSPATETIERLGLAPLLVERGAPRTWPEIWTPYGGWFQAPEDLPDGWGVTRRTLDPLLRDLAVNTPRVEFFPGRSPNRVLFDRGRASGMELVERSGRSSVLHARLVVGADGRDSTVARLAGVPGRVRPHNRFFHFAYWRGIGQARIRRGPPVRLWMLDPEGAAQFPNEDDLTLLVAGFPRWRLDQVRANLEHSYLHAIAGLPDGPDLSGAERVSKILGKLEMPNVIRPAAGHGLAFVGDAALATDPLFGVGITFAFQSAAWLVDETSAVLDDEDALGNALARYRRKFLRRLGPHHVMIADFSTARKMRPIERFVFRRAPADPVLARAFGEVLARERSPFRLFDPRIAVRLALARRTSTVNSHHQPVWQSKAMARIGEAA